MINFLIPTSVYGKRSLFIIFLVFILGFLAGELNIFIGWLGFGLCLMVLFATIIQWIEHQ